MQFDSQGVAPEGKRLFHIVDNNSYMIDLFYNGHHLLQESVTVTRSATVTFMFVLIIVAS
jgi:hypothetical protein